MKNEIKKVIRKAMKKILIFSNQNQDIHKIRSNIEEVI